MRILGKKGFGSHHETGSAETALIGLVIDECLRDAIEVHEVLAERFCGLNDFAGSVAGQHHAGIDRGAINENGAVSTFAAVAAKLGGSEPELFADDEIECPIRFDFDFVFFAVDIESETRIGISGIDDGVGFSNSLSYFIGDGVGNSVCNGFGFSFSSAG